MKLIAILITNRATTYGGAQLLRQVVLFVFLGNPIVYKGNVFTWEQGRKLARGTLNGNSFSYAYDGNGMRFEKTVNGTTTSYYYDGTQLLMESKNGKRTWYIYGVTGVEGMIVEGGYQGIVYYFDKNTLGDVIAMYDESGKVMAIYEYDAWGNVTVMDGSGTVNTSATFIGNINPIRYRGYYYDTETEFYYLQTRYYDPEIMRFINADNYELVAELSSVPGQLNMYAYCNNNPLMYTDETGELVLSTLLIGALVGFGVSFLSSVVMQAAFNEGEVDWGAALIDGAFGAVAGAVGAWGLPKLAVGGINALLSLGNGVITTGLDQNWQFSGMDWGVIVGTSVLSGLISMRFYNQSAVKATNSFTAKIRGRISSGYYGTGARAAKSIASATAQANKMVLNTYFAKGFYAEYLASFANTGLSQWGNTAKYYLP